MTRIVDKLWVAFYCLVLGGACVALCRSLGVTGSVVVHGLLIGWIVMAGVILVTGLVVPVWENAGQPSPTRKRKGPSRDNTGYQDTSHLRW